MEETQGDPRLLGMDGWVRVPIFAVRIQVCNVQGTLVGFQGFSACHEELAKGV